MNSIDKQYLNIGYWFLIFVALVILGFYPTYFGIWSFAMPGIIHIHAFFMVLWLAVLIAQPILIKKKRYRIHRQIGKLSYVLVPMILVAAYFMTRHSYFHAISTLEAQVASGKITHTPAQILYDARLYMGLPVIYFLWFATFYVLAVINKRRPMVHAQFMIATALTLIGPTVDRILFSLFRGPAISGVLPIESVAFVITILILLFLMWYDYKKGYSMKTISICLVIYVAGQIGYFLLPPTRAYQSFVALLMGA
jgi:hypothetical protein